MKKCFIRHRKNIFLVYFFLLKFCLYGQVTVVINEMMIDPSPPVGLPNAEFIELYNVSGSDINLLNYSIGDLTKTAKLPNYILKKDSFIILCSSTNTNAFRVFGNTLGLTNFPSLNNDKDTIILYDANQNIMHSIAYDDTWFANSTKQDGGWSLELANPSFAFSGSNLWHYSTDARGGTPGKMNATFSNQKDTTLLSCINYKIVNNRTLQLYFNKALDKKFLQQKKYIHFTNSILAIDSLVLITPLLQSIFIYTSKTFEENIIYELNIDSLLDANQMLQNNFSKIIFGIPSASKNQDMIINEVLFNALAYEAEFIELYNNSEHIFDLSQYYFAKYEQNMLKDITPLSKESRYFFPRTFFVITNDAKKIIQKYPSCDTTKISEINLPSLLDDSATLLIANRANDFIDIMNYNKNWQYPNLMQSEGVSLEKIFYTLNGKEKSAWYSAAYPYYGTPTLKNSQFQNFIKPDNHFYLNTNFITPNADGINDFILLNYQFSELGKSIVAKIFTLQGALVSTVINGILAGTEGIIQWNGTNDSNLILASGNYILMIEYLDQNGNTTTEKFLVTIAL